MLSYAMNYTLVIRRAKACGSQSYKKLEMVGVGSPKGIPMG